MDLAGEAQLPDEGFNFNENDPFYCEGTVQFLIIDFTILLSSQFNFQDQRNLWKHS